MTTDWTGHTATAGWIPPQANQGTFPNSTGSGTYAYRITFDLAGLDPATAAIQGSWSTDNFGLDVLLNGASTGNTHAAEPPSMFTYFAAFTISTGFVAGVNTLDFVVNNAPWDRGTLRYGLAEAL